MPETLPPRPDLAWLKKAAKQRLSALRETNADAKLHHAQLAIARDYGFQSWRALKAHVDGLSLDGQIVAATREGRADDLERLLAEHPAKRDLIGGQWQRPLLHLAAEAGQVATVDRLLRLGFDANQRDRSDRATPLHWAAQEGHLRVVERLLAAGADLDDHSDAHEMGVLGWATCFQAVQSEVADVLMAHGAKPNLFAAIALGRSDLVRGMLDADPDSIASQMSRFESHRTPLHFAVLKDRAEMVALLLEHGADPLAKDNRGYTPLNQASSKTDPAIVALLIEAGADPREHSPNRFESAVPILNVRNVPASLAYYVDKLGFEKAWEWGTPADFACVQRDEVMLFLCQDGQGGGASWVSLFIHDVDALHEDYKRTGAIVRQPPTNFPWGLREMNVEDLDGHRLRIGSNPTGGSDGEPLNEEA